MVNDTLQYIIEKYNLEIGRQYIVSIPNMARTDLATLFAELGFDLGVEIGVDRGLYSEVLCTANPRLHLYSVDPWVVMSQEPELPGQEAEQRKFDMAYVEAIKRLAPYTCDVMRRDSASATTYFPNDSLDFVYIDGSPEFANVAFDIHAWGKKVRRGGIIAGNNYAFFSSKKNNHVKHVVQAYTRAYGIIPHFVVGAEAVNEPDVVRDSIRSWFWIKS